MRWMSEIMAVSADGGMPAGAAGLSRRSALARVRRGWPRGGGRRRRGNAWRGWYRFYGCVRSEAELGAEEDGVLAGAADERVRRAGGVEVRVRVGGGDAE